MKHEFTAPSLPKLGRLLFKIGILPAARVTEGAAIHTNAAGQTFGLVVKQAAEPLRTVTATVYTGADFTEFAAPTAAVEGGE